jgi:hypothetical protein
LIKNKTTDLIIAPTVDKDRVLIYELERVVENPTKPELNRIMAN